MAAAKNENRVLIVDADGDSAQKVGLSLDGAGFQVGWCSFAPSELGAVLRDLKPTLLVVHAELASPQLSTLIARLESAGMASLPIVLLCRDTTDDVFLHTLRTGVVEMFAEPFNPRPHIGRLRLLTAELPERTGKLRGKGMPNELGALVHHIMRTRRTGGILVGENEEGRAFFVRGVLKAARYGALTMQSALAAMTRAQVAWSFVEGLEGTAGVVDVELGEDEPLGFAKAPDPNRYEDRPPTPTPIPAPAFVDPVRGPISTPLFTQPAPDAEAARTSLLFVDDDTAVVQMLGSFFSKKGYQVVTASDGVEAMGKLVGQPFDGVIADLNMPRLDGWGLLRLIREDLRTHEVPVALFSAQDNYRESLRLLHAGAQAYFPKTLRLTSLEVQVKELLEPRRRFARLVNSDGGLSFDLSSLGLQWVCRVLARESFSGQLDAADGWATWRVWFDEGRLVQASARMGTNLLSGDRALASLLMAKKAEGSLMRGTRAPEEGFGGQPTRATLERLVPWLASEQAKSREDQLSKARALTVNDDLYRLYVTVGPPAWLPMVRLLCESKLAPAEVMARLQVTPMEVATVVKDLLRRGVATLQ